jgi:hypothetical protein
MNYQVGDLAKQNGQYVRVTGVNKDGTLQVRPLTSTEIADAGLAQAQPQQQAQQAQPERSFFGNAWHGLTTNEPTSGVGGFVGRNALPIVGSGIGAAGGTVLGVGVGSVPGAGIGAAAGESTRQALVSAVNPGERVRQSAGQRAADVAAPVAISGALGSGGQKGVEVIGQGIRAAAQTLGPSAISLMSKVPVKDSTRLVQGKLRNAPTVREAGKAYEEAIKPLGLKSLDASLKEATGKNVVTGADFVKVADTAIEALNNGTLTPQQALWGRQAIVKMREASKYGRDEYLGAAKTLDAAQDALDDFLVAQLPDLAAARGQYALAKSAEKFSNWLPVNKDGTPNVARAWATTALAPWLWPVVSPHGARSLVHAGQTAGPATGYVLQRSAPALKDEAQAGIGAMQQALQFAK